ncbi:GNAT family N-acetyltransferase [Christiangramia sp. SM2212]|uniref:GNAT family N-acetyltransferase n=1 Tax=Christiangramia sediminicola TaxID=3073267 RepID=A0ABU1EQ03_9FLAO|nr:GNAT family N-acetyltransferase [Christiangramia sp. SM2212]MDR5590243.1 GNAT family N-acetyltransferase [Christiangramia sp. SM2212]
MIKLIRTNASNSDFIELVKKLDDYLAVCDGDEHEFYDQFNKLDSLNHVVILYHKDQAVGCGAFKKKNARVAEIKRMYIDEGYRNNGYACIILKELETWAKELNYLNCILETGLRMTEAVKFYKKNNYRVIPNYPPFENIENSICFEKALNE